MLTPYFEIRQSDSELILLIHAPYANIKETEIYAEGNDFRFYSSPYYLRLHFPGFVKDIDEPCARYLTDEKQFEVKLHKQNAGEHFPDLDLIGGLLAPKKKVKNIKPDIQVLSSIDNDDEKRGDGDIVNQVEEESTSEDENEWLIDQQVVEPSLQGCSLNCPRYGFGNQTSNAFARLGEEFYEIVNLRDIDVTAESRRDELMHDDEEKLFSDDHYLSDLMEPEGIQPFIEYCPPWRESDAKMKLSKTDLETLKNFGNKEYLLTKDDEISAFLSLFDVIFACVYDFRTTMGESSVESAWTINKLSATLSWLKIFKSPEDVVKCCLRRSLIYPLYRHWNLANIVLQDTVIIFNAGKRHVLWLLLRIYSLFGESEPRYMLNELYIKDYCIWLQNVSDKKLRKFASIVEQVMNFPDTPDKSIQTYFHNPLASSPMSTRKYFHHKSEDFNVLIFFRESESDTSDSEEDSSSEDSSSSDSDNAVENCTEAKSR
ncbi:protein SHQ1 homolog [Nilaparvata lugens]|uniref:protein SHQ1 homolog n=1 Tax=Nilaparvata lugens TaxID=108931 RepID=UPI00193CF196|nr:protein SHQ1 homolog [Nilaparvata lugens]